MEGKSTSGIKGESSCAKKPASATNKKEVTSGN